MTKNSYPLLVMTILMHLLCTGEFYRFSNTSIPISTFLSVVTKYDSHGRTVFYCNRMYLFTDYRFAGYNLNSYQLLYIDIICICSFIIFFFYKNITNVLWIALILIFFFNCIKLFTQ